MVSAPSKSVERRVRLTEGQTKRVGADVDAQIYNELLDYSEKMEVHLSWIVRRALDQFTADYREKLLANPTQLALDLGLR
jgi:hypothetical protein